jgi:hypothetical protein
MRLWHSTGVPNLSKSDEGEIPCKFEDHRPCCAVLSFRENNCTVTLPKQSGKWICLSGTRYQDAHSHKEKLCDLLFSWEKSPTEPVCCALELKGGGISVSGVVEQLQQGAAIIESLLPGSQPIPFTPVLVHRGLSSIQVTQLKRQRILFFRKSFSIELMRCGGKVEQLRFSL